jgi:hypothetical protein
VLALSLVVLGGCHPAPVAEPAVAPPPPPPLHLGPLSDLVPAAGLRGLLAVRLGELLLPASLGKFVDDLIEPDKLAALADLLGFDPRLADEVLVADYGASTLFLFRVAHDPEVVERRFRERVPGGVTRVQHEPRIVRLSGAVGKTLRSLVFLDAQVIALEVGGETYAQAVVAFATGRLHRARPALVTAPLGPLVDVLVGKKPAPPLLALFPRPGEQGWSTGAHGLLAVTTAVGLTASVVTPTGTGAGTDRSRGLSLELVALGSFGDDGARVRERLVGTVRDVVTSGLGSLLGLDEPTEPYVYEVTPERLGVRCTWDAGHLAHGLRAVTARSIRDIVAP